jgi:hypothetical protein
MALPENVLGTIEQSITFRGIFPVTDNLVLAATRSQSLRELHDDMLTLMPMPGAEPEEESLRQVTIPSVGLTVDNVVRIAHAELTLSDVVDGDGNAFVTSLRIVFTQAVLS